MKVFIRNNNHVYEAYCQGKACDYCPFRFRCYTEKCEFEVTTDELDDLSMRMIAGGDLLNLIHTEKEPYHYYRALFFKITAERIMERGFIPLLTRPRS